jgi:hypothetical protein
LGQSQWGGVKDVYWREIIMSNLNGFVDIPDSLVNFVDPFDPPGGVFISVYFDIENSRAINSEVYPYVLALPGSYRKYKGDECLVYTLIDDYESIRMRNLNGDTWQYCAPEDITYCGGLTSSLDPNFRSQVFPDWRLIFFSKNGGQYVVEVGNIQLFAAYSFRKRLDESKVHQFISDFNIKPTNGQQDFTHMKRIALLGNDVLERLDKSNGMVDFSLFDYSKVQFSRISKRLTYLQRITFQIDRGIEKGLLAGLVDTGDSKPNAKTFTVNDFARIASEIKTRLPERMFKNLTEEFDNTEKHQDGISDYYYKDFSYFFITEDFLDGLNLSHLSRTTKYFVDQLKATRENGGLIILTSDYYSVVLPIGKYAAIEYAEIERDWEGKKKQ